LQVQRRVRQWCWQNCQRSAQKPSRCIAGDLVVQVKHALTTPGGHSATPQPIADSGGCLRCTAIANAEVGKAAPELLVE
jgi:hypothetical protein